MVKRVLFILDHLGEDLSFHAGYVIAHTLFAIIDYLLVCTSQQLEEASSINGADHCDTHKLTSVVP